MTRGGDIPSRPVSPRTALALVLTLILAACTEDGLRNQLQDHPSPYLALHGQDPVAWQDWSGEVLERARRSNRLILISSGYFACHWCHVMQRESFQDPDIAAELNAHFIPVKLDRELEPAADAYLIDFVERTRGQAGWPLNVFLTPEGYPLVGTVYLPPEEFMTLLLRLRREWEQSAEQLAALARDAANSVSYDLESAVIADGQRLARGLQTQAMELADVMSGGFGQVSKFPMAPQLEALLALYAREGDPQLGGFLELTFDNMASGGLHDLLGGGFFRYTVDPGWEIPHFEKMLYDNAQLARLYIEADALLDREGYAGVGRETLDFLLRRFRDDDGLFIASLSAVDAAGVEGGYYLWRTDELAAVFEPREWSAVGEHWRFLSNAEIEAIGRLPVQRGGPWWQGKEQERELLEAARGKLLEVRSRRSLPEDGKRLAAWNGLALSALAAGAGLEDGQAYADAAVRLRDALREHLWIDGALVRSVGPEGPVGTAGLEDYALVARGLLDLAEISGSQQDLDWAEQLVRTAWSRFWEQGRWYLTDRPLLPGMSGEPVLADEALPAASAVLIESTRRLLDLGRPTVSREVLDAALSSGNALLVVDAFWYASHTALLIGDRPAAVQSPMSSKARTASPDEDEKRVQ
jgi:uncharacterized protein YyaL (SSP411 family)